MTNTELLESPRMNDDYKNGLLDAITEIDAELACVEIEYADALPCLRAARRALTNAKQLILDKLAIETPSPAPAPPAAQPVAEVGDLVIQVRERVIAGGAKNRDPLYAAPQQAVSAQPLTDKKIQALYDMYYRRAGMHEFVRAVESAHGITWGKGAA